MKKKLFLALSLVALLVCLFAITVSAANEVTVIGDSGTETVGFETVFNLKDGYVAGFKDSATYGKHNIQDVIFPETIVGFNNSSKSLFKESTVLKSITFKGTSVDMYDCSEMFTSSSIQSVIFEQGHDCVLNVHAYTKSVFYNCVSLTTIKFPTITKLNNDGTPDNGDALTAMFSDCTNMVAQNDIVFGEGLTTLGNERVFENCTSLSNNAEKKCDVYFPSTIVTISHKSFNNSGITALHFKKNSEGTSALTTIGHGSYGEGTFKGCTKLTSVDFTGCTNLANLCKSLFNGCTGLTTVIGLENTSVQTIPESMFYGCTALTTIPIPNGLTSINYQAFYKCSALTGTYTFPNLTTIGKEVFRYAATNEGTNLVLSFPSLVTLGGNSGDTHVFSNSGITELSFGDDVKEMSHNTFTSCSRLWRVEFAGFAEGFTFKSYTFENCSALKAFSIPEGITSLPNRMFKNCSSLTAVYLPSTLTAINSGDNDSATFNNCTSLYFVNEPFTYKTLEEIPTEPEVYYFPTGLTTMTGETFDGSRVNDVVVFPTGLTDLSDGYTFEGSKSASGTPTVVLLGDMTAVTIKSWGVKEVYFCHPNDIDSSSAGITGSKTFIFCHAEGNTAHLYEKTVTTDATCTTPAGSFTYCFCGTLMTSDVVEGSVPLGHVSEGAEIHIYYPVITDANGNEVVNYFANAIHSYVCQREGCGADVDEEKEETALFTEKGYSKAEESGDAFTYGIKLNKDAEAEYIANGNVIAYGFIIGAVPQDANGNIINSDGTTSLETYIQTDFAKSEYENFSIYNVRMFGLTEDQKAKTVYCCAYVIDGEEVYYVGEAVTKTAEVISYNSIPATTPPSNDEENA